MSWVQRPSKGFKFVDTYGTQAVALDTNGRLWYTRNVTGNADTWVAKGGSYRFRHVSLFGSAHEPQCVGIRTNGELVRCRNLRSQGFGHVPFRGYYFTKVYLFGNDRYPNYAIGIRTTGEVVVTSDLNHAYWGHMPGNPKFVDLAVYGASVAGIDAGGVTYFADDYRTGRWLRSPGLGSVSMKFKQIELYGVSASGINHANEMYVTDDITKGKWRKIPTPAKGLFHISMYSHNMAGIATDYKLYTSQKPDLGKIIGELGKQVGTLKGENAKLKARINAKNAQITSLQKQRTALTKRVATLTARLKTANANKAALTSQLQQARSQLAALTSRLASLEKENRALRRQLESAQKELGDARDTITTLQSEQQHLMGLYQDKIEELLAARTAIQNLEDTNSEQLAAFQKRETDLLADIERVRAQYAEASAEVKQLAADLETQKSEYETLRTSCPIIPEGTVVLDGDTGQLYRQDNKTLRPMSPETWRSLGSQQYTVYKGYMLQNCEKGDPIMIEPTTPAPEPETTTPAPVSWDPTLYAIIHRDTYMNDEKLHVLTARFGSVSLEPYTQRDLAQVFLISTDGRLRNASGSGPYLEHTEGCLMPALRDESTNDGVWTITSTGEAYTNTLVSACGAALHANEGSTAVDLARQMDGSTWFLVPVGRAST